MLTLKDFNYNSCDSNWSEFLDINDAITETILEDWGNKLIKINTLSDGVFFIHIRGLDIISSNEVCLWGDILNVDNCYHNKVTFRSQAVYRILLKDLLGSSKIKIIENKNFRDILRSIDKFLEK